VKSLLTAVLLAAMFGVAGADAQTYPSRPVTLIVPFAAGGPTDVIGRVLAQHMATTLGQTVVVENVTGAAGSTAVGRVARSAPDGYTISLGHVGTHVINGAIYPLQYDVVADFAPIALVASNPQLIVAKKTIPANDLKGFIAWLKANPGTATEGNAGVGSPSHVAGVYFQNQTGTTFQFVPYRGSGPLMQDIVSGQIDFTFDQAANSLPQVRAGTIKAFAVTAKTRLAAAPDIPTVDEAGLPGLYVSVWHGLWVPKATPPDVVAKLAGAVVAALADAKVRARLEELGQDLPPKEQQTPEGLGAMQKAEIEKWWPLIKAAGIKVE
jgi:tripartite-type tricarboxylate transporter receptor subunit TctC